MAGNIAFEEEPQYKPLERPKEASALTRLVLMTGIVNDEQHAQYILLGVALIAAIAAGLIFLQAMSGTGLQSVPHDQVLKMQQVARANGS